MDVPNARDLLNISLTAACELDDSRLSTVLCHLSDVADVKFSTATATACIRRQGERYTIEFNRAFVRRRLETPFDLLFVLSHEILHKTRGDLLRDDWKDLGPVGQAVANLVADVRTNRVLCRDFFSHGVTLFSRLYRADRFPDVLLIPPVNLLTPIDERAGGATLSGLSWRQVSRSRRRDLVRVLKQRLGDCRGLPERDDQHRVVAALAKWYMDAYFEERVSTQSLFERLRGWFQAEPRLLLLGDHDGRGGALPGFGDSLRETRIERGHEEDLALHVRPHVQTLHHAIRAALEPDPFCPTDHAAYVVERSVIPAIGRREALLLAEGVWPVFFRRPTLQTGESDHRVHLYIDVSGSTDDTQPFIYGLALHLGDLIGEPIYLFSNQVAAVGLDDIRDGLCRTTGGTDFDCVVEHALRNHFRKVLIITDGFADMRGDNQERVRRQEVALYVLLTKRHRRSILQDLARKVWHLDLVGK